MEFANSYLQQESKKQYPNYGYYRTSSCNRPRNNIKKILPLLLKPDQKKDSILWSFLFAVWPDWCYGLQGTGDCVSWGTAHMLDCTMAFLTYGGDINQAPGLQCSESIYGFGKSELFNSYRHNYPGMAGIDAINAIAKFGTLYRTIYDNYDLRAYSGLRAIAWGEHPMKTHGVPDTLQPIAFQHLILSGLEVTDAETAGMLLQNGIAFQWCGQTQWGLRRDLDGMACEYAHGAHCMTATGVRYKNNAPYAFWIANTGHGAHCTGPVGPYPMPDRYAACGSWIPAGIIDSVLQSGDCHACTGVSGF